MGPDLGFLLSNVKISSYCASLCTVGALDINPLISDHL